MRLRWSKRAREDLLGIGRYIAANNPSAARSWVEQLRNQARWAVEHPYSGRMVPEYSLPNLREFVFRNYRIVYRVETDLVVVVTLFEGHRPFPTETALEP